MRYIWTLPCYKREIDDMNMNIAACLPFFGVEDARLQTHQIANIHGLQKHNLSVQQYHRRASFVQFIAHNQESKTKTLCYHTMGGEWGEEWGHR